MSENIVMNVENNTSLPVASSTTDLLLDPIAVQRLEAVANLMAGGKATVPAHLQGNTADCFAVCIQAAQWKMNPFIVAQKTHLVGGTLGYEAQLVNAVVSSSTAIEGSFHYEWFGDWSKVIGNFKEMTNQSGKSYIKPNWSLADEKGLGVRVWATLRGESDPRILELLLSQAQVRNSTLWASDPKQQLAYLGVKRWVRLYAPAVIMGVYTTDELDPTPRKMRDVNPRPVAGGSTLGQVIDGVSDADPAKYNYFCECIESAASMDSLKKIAKEIGASYSSGELSDDARADLMDRFKKAKADVVEADRQASQSAA